MIAFNQIQTTVKPHPERDFSSVVSAGIKVESSITVDVSQTYSDKASALEKHRRAAKMRVWHTLYGDLTQPIAELVVEASSLARCFEDAKHLRELGEKLLAKLRPQDP